jgi:hypothetical protein
LLLTRTFDYPLLHRLMVRDARLYAAMADDGAPAIAEYSGPERDDRIVYLLVEDDRWGRRPIRLGFFALIPRGEGEEVLELHTVMPLRGRALEAMRALFQWVWVNYPNCESILTWVPEFNAIARRFAKRAGFIKLFEDPDKFVKGGVLQAQVWYGIAKGK